MDKDAGRGINQPGPKDAKSAQVDSRVPALVATLRQACSCCECALVHAREEAGRRKM
jgi:hypothetical protein